MASTFSDRLQIELIGDGEQSGSWGTTTNNNLSQCLEQSIAGVETIAISGDVTLSTGNGPQSQADNQARQACLIFTGSTVATVTVPAQENIYHIYNNSSAIITLLISGTSTDFVMAATTSYLIACTGSAWHALNDDKVHFAAAGTVSNTSGDITIDAVGDIALDAGGGGINFLDDGTQIGALENDSTDFIIKSNVSDRDIIFKGNDAGSGITALTLDMSAAGAATFTAGVTGTTGTFASGVTVGSTVITNGSYTHSGSLTLDVDGDLTIDVDGDDIILGAGSSGQFGGFTNTSGNLIIKSGSTTAATFSGANVTFAGTLASGAITSSGDVTAFSDARLKTGIRNIDNALNMVGDMRGVYFTKDGEAGTGVIAQEVENILPEVVKDGEYKSVAYGNMVGVLIEAIKELKKEVETLKESK